MDRNDFPLHRALSRWRPSPDDDRAVIGTALDFYCVAAHLASPFCVCMMTWIRCSHSPIERLHRRFMAYSFTGSAGVTVEGACNLYPMTAPTPTKAASPTAVSKHTIAAAQGFIGRSPVCLAVATSAPLKSQASQRGTYHHLEWLSLIQRNIAIRSSV